MMRCLISLFILMYMNELDGDRIIIPAETTRTEVPAAQSHTVRGVDVDEAQAYGKKKAVFRSYQLVWLIVGFIDTVLAFRFFFELLGANAANDFVQMIY